MEATSTLKKLGPNINFEEINQLRQGKRGKNVNFEEINGSNINSNKMMNGLIHPHSPKALFTLTFSLVPRSSRMCKEGLVF